MNWLKDSLIAVFGLVALAFAWLLHGSDTKRLREAQEEADAIDEAMRRNAKADNSPPDSELDKRVRDEFGKR